MKLFNGYKACIIFLCSVFFSLSVTAETKLATVYTKFSDQDIVDILEEKYSDVKIVSEGTIIVTFAATKHLIDNSRENGSLKFLAIFPSDEYSLSDVNKWNREKRFVSAHLQDNDLVLSSDLDVELGISKEYLLNFAERFIVAVFLFKRQHN